MSPQIQKIMAFEKEIKEYEDLRRKYQTLIINKMDREEYIKYNEVLFSTFSCAIEGNSFSVDDTRELKEKGLGMIPAGKTLFEAFEMLDHFEAFEYMMQNTQHPLALRSETACCLHSVDDWLWHERRLTGASVINHHDTSIRVGCRKRHILEQSYWVLKIPADAHIINCNSIFRRNIGIEESHLNRAIRMFDSSSRGS